MNYVISTLVTGALVWWFALGPGRKAGEQLSPFNRKLLGGAACCVGILLSLRGRIDIGIVALSVGAWLWGIKLPQALDPVGNARISRIRTRALEVLTDMGNGERDARILAGRFTGRALSQLSIPELLALADELMRIDPEGLSLLADQLDRLAPGWRENVHFDAAAGPGAASALGSEMRVEEAYQILGLEKGAGEEAIRGAHRALIGRFHPDKGGSGYLAALVNRARDVALGAAKRG